MSTRFKPYQTNRTPWAEDLTLISQTVTKDEEGYETVTEIEKEIFCCFYDGVSRGEFYESMKAGMQASVQAEVWADDYERETLAEHDGIRYKVLRHHETGRGTLMLILQEVVR